MACYHAEAFYIDSVNVCYVFNQDSDENAIKEVENFIKESQYKPEYKLGSVWLYRVDGFGFSGSTEVAIADFIDNGNGILEYNRP